MVVVAPDSVTLPALPTTCPPSGAAWAKAALSNSAAAMSLRPDPLPRPREVSATATQPFIEHF